MNGEIVERQLGMARNMLVVASVVAVIATFLPWFRLGGEGDARVITPALASSIGTATLFVVGLLVCGAVVALVGKGPILLGVAGSVYATITVVLWLFGSRTSSLLPKRLLPDDLTVRLNFGADVGVIASILMIVALFVLAFESTWSSPIDLSHMWIIAVGAVVSALLISAREASWAVVETFDFEWRLTVDSIPFFGDLILFLLLLTAISVVVTGVFQRTILIIACIFLGVVVLVVGLIGWLARNAIVDLGEWASRRAPFIDSSSAEVRDSYGPIQLALVALAVVVFGVIVFLVRETSSEKHVTSRGTREASEDELDDPY